MEELPPNWIFIGNKPNIKNVTFIVVRDDELGREYSCGCDCRWSRGVVLS